MTGHIHTRTPPLRYLVRLLTLVLAAAFIWYGLMTALVATKVLSGHSANAISGYRSLYNDAVSLTASDFTSIVRIIAGIAGLLVFLVFLYLALQEIPRPRLAGASDLELERGERGRTVVRAGALARVASVAARGNENVADAGASARPHEIHVDIVTRDPTAIADTLTDVGARVRAELDRHDLPLSPVSVTLTNLDRTTRKRELQ